MVLGLYYITKLRKGAKGEGLTFYGPEEALIAYNEGKCDIHAPVSVIVKDVDENGNIVDKMMHDTSVGRVIVNEIVPAEAGYINTIISKKSLRDIISHVIKVCGVAKQPTSSTGSRTSVTTWPSRVVCRSTWGYHHPGREGSISTERL